MSEHIDHFMLDAYVEQTLPAVDRRTVEAHITTCPMCQARLADAKQMTALLYELPREKPASNLAARINATLAAQRAPVTMPQWTRALVPAAFALGIALLMLSMPQWLERLGAVIEQFPTEQAVLAWLSSLLTDPATLLDSLALFVEQWLAGSAEEMNALVMLGMVLLAVASMAGLGQLLGGERKDATPKLA